jgi:hypothetical protein
LSRGYEQGIQFGCNQYQEILSAADGVTTESLRRNGFDKRRKENRTGIPGG